MFEAEMRFHQPDNFLKLPINKLLPSPQAADLKAIQDEIRKLKAVIVKHENRIRALEAAAKARDEENNINADVTDSVTKNLSQLAPDEV